MSKKSLLNKWCWEICTARCKKMKLNHQFTPYTRINSRWIKDLNAGHDTIKVLKETLAGKSQTFHAATSSQTHPLKKEIKERINKWDLIKIKSFCMAKENIIKTKREPTGGKTYLLMISQTST